MALGQVILVANKAVPWSSAVMCPSQYWCICCSPGGHQRNSAPAAYTNKLGEFLVLYVGTCLWCC